MPTAICRWISDHKPTQPLFNVVLTYEQGLCYHQKKRKGDKQMKIVPRLICLVLAMALALGCLPAMAEENEPAEHVQGAYIYILAHRC